MVAQTSEIKIATYAAPLSRDGPGLLLRDILKGDDQQILSIIAVVNHISPDVLVLTDFDFDAGGAALSALSSALTPNYPYHFSQEPNAGVQIGLDLDGDGRLGEAGDALGYGRFFGDGGMAILSRFPILADDAIDLTGFLWKDVANAILPRLNGAMFPSTAVFNVLPASSTAHWIVPINVNGTVISLLAFDATPPVFDGAEDFNGLRNQAELLLWENVLDGQLGPVPENPVLIGNANIDPFDGDGLQDAISRIVRHSALQDPQPRSSGAQLAADTNHSGPPAYDTADWPDGAPGNLRVSYVLPSSSLTVADAGVFWPAPDDHRYELLGREGGSDTGAHHLVWVDLMLEGVN